MTQEHQVAQEPQVDAVDAANVAEQGGTLSELDQLRAQLAAAEEKANHNYELALRTKADADNAQRRAKQDVENAHKFALNKFVQELLPVADSLELGLNATLGGDDSVAKLREGVDLTLKMLNDVFEKFGVKAMNPIGEVFDPEKHQAMSMQESADMAPNTVMAVFQKGYLLNDRLIRPAMVVVTKAVSQPPTGGVGQNIDQHA